MGNRVAPLIPVGVGGNPNLGPFSRWGLVILQLTTYPLLLRSMVKATSIWMIGMVTLRFSQHSLFVIVYSTTTYFYYRIRVVVLGYRDVDGRHGS